MTGTYWRLTFAFGIATLAMSLYILPLFPTTSHDDVSGYGSPIFAFEMVSSVADMESVFGPQEDPMRVKRITQMDNGNRWDFGFMFLYAMFMGLFSLAVYKKDGGVLWLGSAIIGLSAGVFDAIENVTLLKLTANFNSPSLLAMIWMPVYAKFIAISISSLAACFHIATQSTVAWKLIGIVAMLACIGTCLALISPAEYGWVIQHTVTLSWVPMLVFCAIHSFRDPLI